MAMTVTALATALPGISQTIDDLTDAKTPSEDNLFLGRDSGASHTTGDFNTGVGVGALGALDTRNNNTASGRKR
jgi:hypothetical protein